MKRILRHYVIDTMSLWVVSQFAEGLIFEGGVKTLLVAGAGVTAASLLAKPVINLLILPINLISFGLFRWVSSAVVLYLVALVVKDFKIIAFNYPGFTSQWIDLPPLHFEGILAFVAFSFILSLIASFVYWLIK